MISFWESHIPRGVDLLEKCYVCIRFHFELTMSIHEKARADRTEGSSPTPELDYANQMVKFKAMPFVLC